MSDNRLLLFLVFLGPIPAELAAVLCSYCLLFFLYLLLQFHQPIDDSFWTGRTSRDVKIDRHNGVDSLNRGIVIVKASGAGAHSKSDYPLWVCHLFIDAH